MSARAAFKNKAHQTAYDAGLQARVEGKERFAPYGTDNRSSLHFRKAWLAGYDAEPVPSLRAALEGLLDVMKRSDMDNPPEGAAPCTDFEWDRAMDLAEQALAGGGA